MTGFHKKGLWGNTFGSIHTQECISVGCVPPTHRGHHVVSPGGMGVHAWGVCVPRGRGSYLPEGVSAKGRGVSCDLSNHTFDVTCMLSLHQLRLITSAAAYIVLGYVTCGACSDTPLPPDRMTDMCKDIIFPQTSFAGGNNQYISLRRNTAIPFHMTGLT